MKLKIFSNTVKFYPSGSTDEYHIGKMSEIENNILMWDYRSNPTITHLLQLCLEFLVDTDWFESSI